MEVSKILADHVWRTCVDVCATCCCATGAGFGWVRTNAFLFVSAKVIQKPKIQMVGFRYKSRKKPCSADLSVGNVKPVGNSRKFFTTFVYKPRNTLEWSENSRITAKKTHWWEHILASHSLCSDQPQKHDVFQIPQKLASPPVCVCNRHMSSVCTSVLFFCLEMILDGQIDGHELAKHTGRRQVLSQMVVFTT